MNELIRELEEKQKTNDTISIDYVLNKLNDIYIFYEYIKDEVTFTIESIVNDIGSYQEDFESCKKLEELTDADITKISDDVCNGLENSYISDVLYDDITKSIYNYINN